jgi:hypothetical protein
MMMESKDDRKSPYPFRVETKTSDGLRFELVRTSYNGHIQFNEEDFARVISEFGSSDPDFVFPLLRRIGKMGIKEKIWDPDIIKFAISFIRGIRPRDPLGALLGFHLMTVHEAINVNFGRIRQARFMQYNEEEGDADRAVNRLVRTLIGLAEAFDRHQSEGEQRLTVRHMAVTNGHEPVKTAKRPKRGMTNGNAFVNGAATDMKRHSEVLLGKNDNGE